jgi:hypothetical protein
MTVAARKKASRKKATSKAVAKRTAGALAPLPEGFADEEYQAILNRDAAASNIAVGGWPFVGTEGGVFSHKSEGPIGDEFDAVILGVARGNFLYEGKYSPGDNSKVVCYALSEDLDAELFPPEDLATKESDACSTCWANEYGSDDRGKGKACRNYAIVAGVPVGTDRDLHPLVLEKAEGFRLRVPPTSLVAFASFAAKVTKVMERAFFTVKSRFHIEKHPQKQFEVTAELMDGIQDIEALSILKGRVKEASAQVMSPPPLVGASDDAAEEEQEQEQRPALQRPGRKKKAGKKVQRRKR